MNYGFQIELIDPKEYRITDLEHEKFLVFLIATYDEGKPTENCREFYSNLMNSKFNLEKLKYVVYGLGNREYRYFCKISIDFHEKIKERGGSALMKLWKGDDNKNINSHFIQWKKVFWDKITKEFLKCPLSKKNNNKFKPELKTSTILKEINFDQFSIKYARAKFHHGFPREIISMAQILDIKQVRSSTLNGSTLHIELDIQQSPIIYDTADNIAIICRNVYREAKSLCNRLKLKPYTVYHFKKINTSAKIKFPKFITPMNCFLWHLNINTVPKKKLLKIFAQHTTDKKEYNFLLELSKKKIKNTKEFWTILRILEKFSSLEIPFSVLVEFLPKLQYRLFTISSSAYFQPTHLSITTKLDFCIRSDLTIFRGVCSNYLSTLKVGDYVQILFKKTNLNLPFKLINPVIMIAPGTGLAPFRAFIQERTLFPNINFGSWRLYFGCRWKEIDYLYRIELETAVHDGVLDGLYIVFSQECRKKKYLQDLLKGHSKDLWNLIKYQKANIYVCGSFVVGKAIRNSLMDIMIRFGNWKKVKQVQNEFELLIKNKRYIQELWG